jgi:hypothetical protein
VKSAKPPQDLSREMILPAYKAAISPGPPLSHTTTSNSANLPAACPPSFWRVCLAGRLNPQESDCPESENVRRITYEFISKLCKTNPILSASGGFKTLYLTKTYVTNAEFYPPKTNPKRTQNEPKQSQADPRFSPVMAPQSQNEPKRTQSKPNSPKTPRSTQPSSTQGLTKKMPNSPQPERTQSNPISNTAPRPACQSE